MARRSAPKPQEVTVRDFSGGWNVVDNELNLSTKFSPVMENVQRGLDGSVSVRQGFRFNWTLEGEQSGTINGTATFLSTSGSRVVHVNMIGHGLANGDHITFTVLTDGVLVTYPYANTMFVNKTFGVNVIDGDNFTIQVYTLAATSGTNTTATIQYHTDTHLLGGEIVNIEYFQDNFIVVGSTGEVCAIDANTLSVTQVWTHQIAQAQAGTPEGWRDTNFVSFMPFGGHLDIFNGQDSPLQLDISNTPPCQYLADPSTGSNLGIPQAAYGVALGGYASLAGDVDDPQLLSISALNTDSVFTGNPAPDDAVDVGTANITNSSTVTIMGLGKIRDKLAVIFDDATLLGTLGTYKTVGAAEVHSPNFQDTISQHGTISHRSIQSLGNDIFMCDRVGVPSITQSQVALTFVPERISDLIEPAIQKNLGRLSRTTQILKIWSVYNPRDRQYMLFMPKYDASDVRTLENDPITVASVPDRPNVYYLTVNEHGFEVGDSVRLSGVVGTLGGLTASEFNRDQTVFSVVDTNTICIEASAEFLSHGDSGGGSAVTIQPLSNENVGYIFTYNQKLKIKAWHKMTGTNFACGCRSSTGRIYFAKGLKGYVLGTLDEPIYRDFVGDYDTFSWANSTGYSTGERVRDGASVYTCLIAHTSAATGTFSDARTANDTLWELYTGNPISFDWELPWADFDKRMHTKAVRHVHVDSTGTSEYTLQLFGDNIYKRSAIGEYTPLRELNFVGGDAGGFGTPSPYYGGGRVTRDQYLWMIPLYAKLLKLRFVGQTTEPLRFVAVSIVYHEGSLQRG